MKTATALLILVLAVIGVLEEYVVWAGYPLSVLDSLTFEFGYCRDAVVTVPPSVFDHLFFEAMPDHRRKPCRYCYRKVGMTAVVDGQVFEGELCAYHGVSLTGGEMVYRFTRTKPLWDILYRYEGWVGMAVRPAAGITDEIFPEERRGDAEAVYDLLQAPLIPYGAPVRVRVKSPHELVVSFRYVLGDTDLGLVGYVVDLDANVAERLKSRGRCGNGPKAVCGETVP